MKIRKVRNKLLRAAKSDGAFMFLVGVVVTMAIVGVVLLGSGGNEMGRLRELEESVKVLVDNQPIKQVIIEYDSGTKVKSDILDLNKRIYILEKGRVRTR